MKKTIAILKGDGIGPEVMQEAIKVLMAIESKYQHEFTYKEALIGGSAFDYYQNHFPSETHEICRQADAILLGSVGGPVQETLEKKWIDCEKNSLLGLRKAFQFYCNIRPISLPKALFQLSPLNLKDDALDILCIRELIGDVYFGAHETFDTYATDQMIYHEEQIKNIAISAFTFAKSRNKKVTSIDKANVLDSSRLWRRVVSQVAKEFPDCTLEHMLVDNCAMQLIRNPNQFDVLLMPNLFGDILSDEASAIVGSLGLIPSASLNDSGMGLYEPMGGSAPDIAGKSIANPIAQILSAALMLRFSFHLEEEAKCIEKSVQTILEKGIGTKDLTSKNPISTEEMGGQIRQEILNHGMPS